MSLLFSTFQRTLARDFLACRLPIHPRVLCRKTNTSASVPSTIDQPKTPLTSRVHEETSISNPQTSLSWIQLFGRSPAGFGIALAEGYEELIPSGTELPCIRKIKCTTVFDYQGGGVFRAQYRLSMVHAPVDLASVDLRDIRLAERCVPTIKVMMMLGKDLTGQLTVRDNFTWSKASVAFDGRESGVAHGQTDLRATLTDGLRGVMP